jgi:hypothetical protein
MLFAVRFESNLNVTTDEGSPLIGREAEDVLEAFLDAIADELHAMAGVVDPSVGASLALGKLEIDLEVDGQSPIDAATSGLVLLQTAFSAAVDAVDEEAWRGRIELGELITSTSLALV